MIPSNDINSSSRIPTTTTTSTTSTTSIKAEKFRMKSTKAKNEAMTSSKSPKKSTKNDSARINGDKTSHSTSKTSATKQQVPIDPEALFFGDPSSENKILDSLRNTIIKKKQTGVMSTCLKKASEKTASSSKGAKIKSKNVESEIKAKKVEVKSIEIANTKVDKAQVERGITLLKNMTEPGIVEKRQYEKIDGQTHKDISGYKKMDLDEIHDQNFNTPNEIISGYKSVMTTDELFTSLSKMYNEGDANEKKSCNEFAVSWLKSGLHKNNYNDLQVQEFFGAVRADNSLSSVYEQALSELQQPHETYPREELNSWSDLMQGSPKEIANEFRSLLGEGIVKITSDDLVNYEDDTKALKKFKENPEMELHGQEGFLSNNALKTEDMQNALTRLVQNDILSGKNKNEAIGTYKKYLEVAEEAMNSGDGATTMLLFMALSAFDPHYISKNDLLPSSNPSVDEKKHYKIEGDLRGITNFSSNFKFLRSLAQKDPTSPVIAMFAFKDYIMANEALGEIKELDNGKEEFNADRIEEMGKQFKNFHERQEKIKSNLTGNYNLAKFLETPSPTPLQIEERKLEISKGSGWGGEIKDYDKFNYLKELSKTKSEFQQFMPWENIENDEADLLSFKGNPDNVKLKMDESEDIRRDSRIDGEDI